MARATETLCACENSCALEAEIERLQARELAWKLIAKHNDDWNALPQSEKEAALHKALESTTADLMKAEEEIERLRGLASPLGKDE